MNKYTLIQYCDLQKEIKKLEERIDNLKKQSPLISDVVQNGYKRHAVVTGYDYNRKHKLDMLEAVLQERYDKCLQMQIEIETYINTILQSDIRQILEHRYIDNMTWLQIMYAMNYEEESKARKKHDKFIEENL